MCNHLLATWTVRAGAHPYLPPPLATQARGRCLRRDKDDYSDSVTADESAADKSGASVTALCGRMEQVVDRWLNFIKQPVVSETQQPHPSLKISRACYQWLSVLLAISTN